MKEKLFLSTVVLATTAAYSFGQVYADPFVSANARAQAVLPNGNFVQTFETGALGASATAIADRSVNTSFTSTTGVTYSAATRSQFISQAGVLRGSSASDVRMSDGAPFSGVRAETQGWTLAQQSPGAYFLDTITVAGAPVGTTVNLVISVLFEGTAIRSAADSDSPTTTNFSWASLDVTSTAGGSANFYRYTNSSGSFSEVQSFVTTVTIGTPFQIGGNLNAEAKAARNNSAGFSTQSVDVMNTGRVGISAPGGYSITSASGFSYAPVPEPASLSFLCLGALGLLRRRSKS